MVRSKTIRAKTARVAQAHKISITGVITAVILFIIGIAAFRGGYENIGLIFIAFGALDVFIAILPLFDLPGWAMAIIMLGAIAAVIIFTTPYVESMVGNLDEFLAELPTHIWDWLLSQSPIP